MSVLFGKKARDKITGFEGMVTGRVEYMYGCAQLCLTPSVDKDGKLREGQWFDDGRIEIIGEALNPATVQGTSPGGPQRDAPKAR